MFRQVLNIKLLRISIMNPFDEAFIPPMMNFNGINKKLGEDEMENYAQMISDYISMLFYNRLHSVSNKKLIFEKEDYDLYMQVAFHKSGDLNMNFMRSVTKQLLKKNLRVFNVQLPEEYYQLNSYYFMIKDDYDDIIIGIGPLKIPIWILN